ncbi:ATP-binding protein [Pseudoalteromonas rubra]|uniref:histidine kinase n=1 Tax=Pseudoalteromonas rubra TaxID=43658 RepID=A0A5S3WZ10_9GAMM|nr:ATP-binding protein [Pseudoalteromonas rubra]TMP36549.1 hybrid sensor histidine kinase/response regulator [Pseudoalteromonas rubra]
MGDPKQLLQILALTSCVCALFMMVNWFIHRRLLGTALWAGFSLCTALGCIFIASFSLPVTWTIFIPNSLILIGLYCLSRGSEAFFSVPRLSWPWWLLGAIFFPGYLYYTYIDANFIARVVLNYLGWALSMLLCLRALWLGQRRQWQSFSPAHWAFALSCVCLFAVFTVRVLMLHHYTQHDSLTTNNWVNQFFSVSVIVMPLILCFSLCLLCSGRREKELHELRHRAELAAQHKERFLTLLSHELRTPLNAIVGHAELLKRAPREPKQHAQFCDVIIATSMSMSDLANQILLQARGTVPNTTIEPVKLANHLSELITFFKPLAEKKHLTLTLTMQGIDTNLQVMLDKDPFTLVIKNLLSNAIKYTERGEVELIVYGYALSQTRHQLRIAVKDTGIGLSPAQQQKVFEPFVTFGASRAIADSAGVGLALCKQLLENMGVDLEVESEPDKGSEFFFEMQVNSELTEQLDVTDSKPTSLGELSVLVVEDNHLNREVVRGYLDNLGLSYCLVENLAAAHAQLENSHFDVILLDMHLPDGHGLEWYQANFNQLPALASAVVMALTGDVDQQARQAYQQAGIYDCLEKPLHINVLRQALERLVQENNSGLAATEAAYVDLAFVERQLGETTERSEFSSRLMYLSDRLDYEFAQLRGLADIQADESLREKLLQLEHEVEQLGLYALRQALHQTRRRAAQERDIDWSALHQFAKQSASALQSCHQRMNA